MPQKVIFFLYLPLIACLLFSCAKDGQKPSPPPSPGDTVTHVTAVTVDPAQLILIPAMTTPVEKYMLQGSASIRRNARPIAMADPAPPIGWIMGPPSVTISFSLECQSPITVPVAPPPGGPLKELQRPCPLT